MWVQNVLKRNWALFALATGGTIFFLIFGMSFQYNWPVVVLVGSQTLEMLFSQAVVPIVDDFNGGNAEFCANAQHGICLWFRPFGAALAPLCWGWL